MSKFRECGVEITKENKSQTTPSPYFCHDCDTIRAKRIKQSFACLLEVWPPIDKEPK